MARDDLVVTDSGLAVASTKREPEVGIEVVVLADREFVITPELEVFEGVARVAWIESHEGAPVLRTSDPLAEDHRERSARCVRGPLSKRVALNLLRAIVSTTIYAGVDRERLRAAVGA